MSCGLQKKSQFTRQSTHEILCHFYKCLCWLEKTPKAAEPSYMFLFPRDALGDVAEILRRHVAVHPYLSIHTEANEFVGVCYSSLRLCEPPYQMVCDAWPKISGAYRYIVPAFWDTFDAETWKPTTHIDPELLYDRIIAVMMKGDPRNMIRVPKTERGALVEAITDAGRVIPQKLRKAGFYVTETEFVLCCQVGDTMPVAASVLYTLANTSDSASDQICQIIHQSD